MTTAAEHRKIQPSDSDAILNALPNPVVLVAPDGKIIDANIAAEAFFDISTQFLQRQSLKELVPFGSPLLSLIEDPARRSTLIAQPNGAAAWRMDIRLQGEGETVFIEI